MRRACVSVAAIAAVFTACLIFALPGRSDSPSPPRANDRCVVLISVDGLAGYYLDDPLAHLPTLKRMAKEGAAGTQMRCSFPTVTWPNHTTLVTGVPPAQHGVLGNNLLDRGSGDPVPLIMDPRYDKSEVVKSPTVYDVAHAAGLKTAAITWPATRNAKTLDWTMPDVATQELLDKYSTPSLLTELQTAGFGVNRLGDWFKAPDGGARRDWLYSQAAAHVIREHRPNLVLLHLIEVDHVEHQHGPQSPEAYWAVSYADDRVRDVIDAIEQAGLRDRATVLVTSDHGFFSYNKTININVVLRREGLLQAEGEKVLKKNAYAVTQSGAAAVYVVNREKRAEIYGRLVTLCREMEGVEAVFEPKDFGSLGQPTPEQNALAPDLWLAAKEGYQFNGALAGNEAISTGGRRGAHGHLPDHNRMRGILVAWGAGIRSGVRLEEFTNLEIAPTVAHLLGLKLPSSQAKPLSKILR